MTNEKAIEKKKIDKATATGISCSVSAIITRADGTIEDLGIIAESINENEVRKNTKAIQEVITVSKTANINPDTLPLHLIINSNISNKVMKQVIPNTSNNRMDCTNTKAQITMTGTFIATYIKDENYPVKIEIASLNDINRLVKDNKFNKFYDFMLHCLDQYKLDNNYLRLSYKSWLKYTDRSTSGRMIKTARKEFKDFALLLSGVRIEFKGKNNRGYNSTPFYSCDTRKYSGYAEIGIDKRFVDAMGESYYTLPLAAGKLSQRAYDVVTSIYWYCRASKKEAGKSFKLRYETLCKYAGIASYDDVKEKHNRDYDRFIYTPMDKIIAEIRKILPKEIDITQYKAPENKDDMLQYIHMTVSDIDYSNVVKLKEKNKKKNEKAISKKQSSQNKRKATSD